MHTIENNDEIVLTIRLKKPNIGITEKALEALEESVTDFADQTLNKATEIAYKREKRWWLK